MLKSNFDQWEFNVFKLFECIMLHHHLDLFANDNMELSAYGKNLKTLLEKTYQSMPEISYSSENWHFSIYVQDSNVVRTYEIAPIYKYDNENKLTRKGLLARLLFTFMKYPVYTEEAWNFLCDQINNKKVLFSSLLDSYGAKLTASMTRTLAEKMFFSSFHENQGRSDFLYAYLDQCDKENKVPLFNTLKIICFSDLDERKINNLYKILNIYPYDKGIAYRDGLLFDLSSLQQVLASKGYEKQFNVDGYTGKSLFLKIDDLLDYLK